MPPDDDHLVALIAAELAEPVASAVARVADAIAAEHPGALAVLFYGSCLRDATLAGMLDFYLIVEDYGRAYGGGWRALANRLLPPNVFPFAKDGLAAKYAVLSLDDLRRETGLAGRGPRDPSTFARLAQPARLIWAANPDAAADIAKAVARAPVTLLDRAAPLAPPDTDWPDLWRRAFALTYGTELRAERASRGGSIVDADPERYARVARAIAALDREFPSMPSAMARDYWRRAARRGKRRQLMKLAKASLTFAGGLDYLAWKINRHAGTAIAIRPWQRRWPILGALSLLPRLVARGAVR